MTVLIDFHLDTRTSNETITVESPFDDRAKAADKVKSLLLDTANSSSAIMKMRDSGSGDYIMVNTMKLASVEVRNDE